MPSPRYAVYFSPEQDSSLAELGARILGRDARTGAVLEHPALPGIDPGRVHALTAEPRRYGLHATLKPPFFLADGATEHELEAEAARVAATTAPFVLPPLRVASIGSFLALALTQASSALDVLARQCVLDLDRFRRPATEAELAGRRVKGLSAVQEQLLGRYGYPYVLEEFRFHLTLTGRIADPAEREAVRAALHTFLAPALARPVAVGALYLFRQPSPAEPFVVWRQIRLGVPKSSGF